MANDSSCIPHDLNLSWFAHIMTREPFPGTQDVLFMKQAAVLTFAINLVSTRRAVSRVLMVTSNHVNLVKEEILDGMNRPIVRHSSAGHWRI